MRATSPASAHRLPFGAFYGTVEHRHCASGLAFAMMHVDPHKVVERHTHDDAHFVFVLDGLYVSSARGAPTVSRGEALVFNPAGTTHRDRFEARDRIMDGQFLTLSVSHDLVRAAEAEHGTSPIAVSMQTPRAMALARRLAAATRADHADMLERESLALALLQEVPRSRDHQCRGVGRAHEPAWLALARAQLDDTLGGTLSIREIAHTAGVHPVHLARVFRQRMGESPASYHRRRRLEHAAALMRDTRRSLADIAIACGFVDQAHLSAAFRRTFGASPRTYRKAFVHA